MVDLWRDFWIRETGTGQQVAQLHDRYDDDDDDDLMHNTFTSWKFNLSLTGNLLLSGHQYTRMTWPIPYGVSLFRSLTTAVTYSRDYASFRESSFEDTPLRVDTINRADWRSGNKHLYQGGAPLESLQIHWLPNFTLTWFASVNPGKCQYISSIRPWELPSKHFLIRHSPVTL
jgi:hypothetical protein